MFEDVDVPHVFNSVAAKSVAHRHKKVRTHHTHDNTYLPAQSPSMSPPAEASFWRGGKPALPESSLSGDHAPASTQHPLLGMGNHQILCLLDGVVVAIVEFMRHVERWHAGRSVDDGRQEATGRVLTLELGYQLRKRTRHHMLLGRISLHVNE